MSDIIVEPGLPRKALRDDTAFVADVVWIRLSMTYPADAPQIPVVLATGLRARVEQGVTELPGILVHSLRCIRRL